MRALEGPVFGCVLLLWFGCIIFLRYWTGWELWNWNLRRRKVTIRSGQWILGFGFWRQWSPLQSSFLMVIFGCMFARQTLEWSVYTGIIEQVLSYIDADDPIIWLTDELFLAFIIANFGLWHQLRFGSETGLPDRYCGRRKGVWKYAFLVHPPQYRAASEYLKVVAWPAKRKLWPSPLRTSWSHLTFSAVQNGIVRPEFGGYLLVFWPRRFVIAPPTLDLGIL